MTRRRRRPVQRVSAGLSLVGTLALLLGFAGSALVGSPGAGATSPFLQTGGDSWAQPTVTKLENDAAAAGFATFHYSAGGISGEDTSRQSVAQGSLDLAVSSSPLSDDELATARTNHITVAYVPYAVGPVSVFSRTLVGDNPMNFSIDTMAKIFTDVILNWSDPAIESENPNDKAALDRITGPIQVVTRGDSSGTNLAMEAAIQADPLGKASWDAYRADHPLSAPDKWPTDSLSRHISATGSEEVLKDVVALEPDGTVATTDNNAIGFINPAYYQPYNNYVSPGAIQNLATPRAYVQPSVDSLTKAEAAATLDPTTNLYTIDYTKITATGAYPIPLVSYLIVPVSGATPAKATALAQFVRFVLSTNGQADVVATGMAGVPSAVIDAGLKVADQLDAEAAATTTTTSSSTTSTTSTSTTASTSTTGPPQSTTSSSTTAVASASPSTTRSPGATSAAAGTGGPQSAANLSTGSGGGTLAAAGLPLTGGAPYWPLVVGGVVLLVVGQLGRRVLVHQSR